jgi:hypothetical protein
MISPPEPPNDLDQNNKDIGSAKQQEFVQISPS